MPIFARQKESKKIFDRIAGIYDRINPHIYTEEMKEALKREIRRGRILDIGVGTGYTTKEFKNAVGIDLSKKMIMRAKNYKGSLLLADGLMPPFKPESFDTIISAGSFYYFPSAKEALRIFYVLLKNNGVFLAITPSLKILKPFIYVYSKRELEALFNSANFRVERIRKVGKIAYLSKARKENGIKK